MPLLPRLRRSLRSLLLAIWVATGALALVPVAHAGNYRYYACQRPDGRPIQTPDWSLESGTGHALGQDLCATDGYAALGFGDTPTKAGDWTGYGLTLPDGLRATLMRMYRWHQMRAPSTGSDVGAHPAYFFQYGQTTRWFHASTTTPDWCYYQHGCLGYGWPNVSTVGGPKVVADFPGGASFIGFALGCRGDDGGTSGTCAAGTGGRALARVLALDLDIRDDAAPVATAVSGALTQPGPRSGTQDLRYAATDVGAGVYLAILEVDGKEVTRHRPDPSPTCVDAGILADTPFEFERVQPCSRALGVTFDLDTTKLTDGPHRLTTRVVDAAGNASNTLAQDVVVSNPSVVVGDPSALGLPNGSGGALTSGQLGLKGERSKLSARYGAKKVSITGRLVDAAGTAIAGAGIDVSEQLAVPAAPWTKVGTVTTAADGKYRFVPTTTATRRIRFSYADRQGAAPRTTREVLLSVTAGMSISAQPRVVARRGVIRLAGRVRIEALPAAGTWVEVQSLQGRSWRTFVTRRVNRSGRWTFRHRLKTAANTTLTFRSRLRPASDLPSEEARSAPVKVRVR